MTRKSLLPPDVIDQWPEVFSDLQVTAVPLAYLHSLKITFKDGRIWDVNIATYAKRADIDDLEYHLQELIESYEEVIENIDFRLDVERVKKDIIKKTNKFLKTRTRKRK